MLLPSWMHMLGRQTHGAVLGALASPSMHVYPVQLRGQLWFSPLLMSLFCLCREDNSYHIYSFGPPKLCFPFSWTLLIKHVGEGGGGQLPQSCRATTPAGATLQECIFFLLLRSFYVLQHILIYYFSSRETNMYFLNLVFTDYWTIAFLFVVDKDLMQQISSMVGQVKERLKISNIIGCNST